MQINKVDNTTFGMALKIDKKLRSELNAKPADFLKKIDKLGRKIEDVKLYNVILEEGKGLDNPVVKAHGAGSTDQFALLKHEESLLGKYYEIPSGMPGDSVGGFYPDEPQAFRKVYGKDAEKKYKEFKALDIYDQAAEYSRILEIIDVRRLIDNEKKVAKQQFEEYTQKMMREQQESAVDELLSRYENDVKIAEKEEANKPSFWSRVGNFIKK